MRIKKTLTKPAIFGVPSLETAQRIDDSDKVEALHAAHYRLTARMRELEKMKKLISDIKEHKEGYSPQISYQPRPPSKFSLKPCWPIAMADKFFALSQPCSPQKLKSTLRCPSTTSIFSNECIGEKDDSAYL